MNKQNGYTLIELMIASLIGVIIITGMLNFFITTNRSVTLSDALSQNQETGRFTMDYLTKFIRLAGYTEDFTQYTPPLFIPAPGISCTAADASSGVSASSDFDACAQNNAAGALGDRLSIPFAVTDEAGSETRTCSGIEVGGANGQQNLVNVFWVDGILPADGGQNYKELRCQTYNRDTNDWLLNAAGDVQGPVSLINNVEGLEFLVGIAATDQDKDAARYVNLDSITSAATPISINRIRSIRIALLTTSANELNENEVQSNRRQRSYGVLDAPILDYTFTDGSLRNIFMNTIELPNMIESAGSN